MRTLLTALLVLLCTGPAHAGYLGANGSGFVNFTARPGETNDVVVTAADGWFVFRDAVPMAVESASACERIDETSARCPAQGVHNLGVSAGDGNDRVHVTLPDPITVGIGGAEGDDLLVSAGPTHGSIGGGYGDDTIDAGDGSDEIDGGPGRDVLDGGPGGDWLRAGYPDEERYEERGGGGADDFRGGDGIDRVSYDGAADVRITLDGVANDGRAGEGDQVRDDIEIVHGGLGNDLMVGNDGSQQLIGGVGDDAIAGLGGSDALEGFIGADLLDAGAGDDLIDSRESNQTVCYDVHTPFPCPGTRDGADAIVCGPGADKLTFERDDLVDRRTCEPPLNPEWAPEDDRQPALLIGAAAPLRAQGRQASVTVACTARRTCRGTLAIDVRGRRAGRRAVAVRRGRAATVRVRLTRRVRRTSAATARFSSRGRVQRRAILLRR